MIFIGSNFLFNMKSNSSLTQPGSFDNFNPLGSIDPSCDCHTDSGAINSVKEGNGTIVLSSDNETFTGTLFQVELSISTFIEAKSHTVTFGLDKDEGDNADFVTVTSFKTVTLDGNGDSNVADSLTVDLLAPNIAGIYTLKAKAIDANGPSNFNKSDIYYLLTDKTITVTQKTTGEGVTGNITANNALNPNIIIGDQKVSSYWDDIEGFEVEEFTGDTAKGTIKAAHDSYNIYVLIAYSSQAKWISIEFDADENNMELGHDGWAFGESSTEEEKSYYGDLNFVGEGHPSVDGRNDVSFEKIVDEENGLVFLEIKRALNTTDTAGKDIIFEEETVYNVKFASAGIKATYHKGERIISTLAISSEFPVGGNNTTTEPTTTKIPIEQVKSQHLESILIWGGLGFVFNVLLISIVFIYKRRS